ncbi:MAG: RluA family pseudouridine synthase [Bdellovibrionales bacterium]|nr:RluA family pseudouridine synthase [Oligoflexia bacterium]
MAHSGQIDQIPPFRILFEDQHLLVLSKRAGLLSQGDITGEVSLVDLLRDHFGRPYVGLLHRLDRNTSGLMIVAKRTKSAERLSAQLIAGELVRNYHALVLGSFPSPEPQHWEHFLLKNEKTNEVRAVSKGTPGAKASALTVKPLLKFAHPKNGSALTLAHYTLETGRSHQIRVQSAAQGYPLIGDTKYGGEKMRELFSRPALHSCSLQFTHPMSKEEMRFEEYLSADMIDHFPELKL